MFRALLLLLIRSLSDWCEAQGLPLSAVKPLVQKLNDRKSAELELCNARARARAAAPMPERLPFTDETGYEYGYTQASIPKQSFHYWGQRLGYECWEDETFLREYLRGNPGARVRTARRNKTVANLWPGRGRGNVRQTVRYS